MMTITNRVTHLFLLILVSLLALFISFVILGLKLKILSVAVFLLLLPHLILVLGSNGVAPGLELGQVFLHYHRFRGLLDAPPLQLHFGP